MSDVPSTIERIQRKTILTLKHFFDNKKKKTIKPQKRFREKFQNNEMKLSHTRHASLQRLG